MSLNLSPQNISPQNLSNNKTYQNKTYHHKTHHTTKLINLQNISNSKLIKITTKGIESLEQNKIFKPLELDVVNL